MKSNKIFIVHSSTYINQKIASLLKSQGFEVFSFFSASSLEEKLSNLIPELIISGNELPDKKGLDLCKKIKSNRLTKDIRFLLISSIDEILNKKSLFYKNKLDDYIIEPFDDNEIIEKVNMQLTIKNLQDELEKALSLIERELETVGYIQKNLLPKSLPKVKNIKFESYYNTFERSGGDYFDFIRIDKSNFGLLIADVSGHGTSSTVVMAMLKIFFTKILNRVKSPAKAIDKLNDLILEMLNIDKYATIFYGIIDYNSLKFTYTNAAHPEPIIINRKTCEVRKLTGKKGLPVGILPDATGSYENAEIRLKKNERIVLYTDGIVEAKNSQREFFGEKRLITLLKDTVSLDITEAKNQIINNLLDYTSKKITDDLTMVMFDVY